MKYDCAMIFKVESDMENQRGYLLPIGLQMGEFIKDKRYDSCIFEACGISYYFPDASISDFNCIAGFPISILDMTSYLQPDHSSTVSYNYQGEEISIEDYTEEKLVCKYREHILQYIYAYQIDENGFVHVYQIDLLQHHHIEVDMKRNIYDQDQALPKILWFGGY